MHLRHLGTPRGSGGSPAFEIRREGRGTLDLNDPRTALTVLLPLDLVQRERGSRDGSRRIDRQKALLLDQLYDLISQAARCWSDDDVDGVRRPLSQC